MMDEKGEKEYKLNKKHIRTSMFLKITGIFILFVWFLQFMFLHFTRFDLPRKVDITLLAAAICLCVLFELIDTIYLHIKCKCPFCGKPWSMMKHVRFRKRPLDIFNKTGSYFCYNCDSEIEIE